MMICSSTGLDSETFALDSNILVYAYDATKGRKHELCRELLEDGFRGEITYFVPLQALSEFYAHVSGRGKSMSCEAALQTIRDIIEFPNFIVQRIDELSVIEAIELNRKTGIHYWDCLLIGSMKQSMVTNIYTENTKHFALPWIRAVNPFSE